MSLLHELKRRNVIRMAGLYLVAAWLVTQVAGTLLPMFEAPTWVARTIVIILRNSILLNVPAVLADEARSVSVDRCHSRTIRSSPACFGVVFMFSGTTRRRTLPSVNNIKVAL
jgi:hypothetical protein